jgi:hypothetical protein
MFDARGNKKNPSKNRQGGKALAKTLLVRIIWKFIIIIFDFVV